MMVGYNPSPRLSLPEISTTSETRIVAMPLIPAIVLRGSANRCDLSYSLYSQATWKWWCERNDVHFIPISHQLDESRYRQLPPTFQKWSIPEILAQQYGRRCKIAVVDADTMIRWDTPDFFKLSGQEFAAIGGRKNRWITQSLQAFQPLFPHVALSPEDYFNSGVVLLGEMQLPNLRAFLEFSLQNWSELTKIIAVQDVGTEQTPLNLFLRREREQIHLLPSVFNLLHCFPMNQSLAAIDRSSAPDLGLFAREAFVRPLAFEFINHAYIWHFTNIVGSRKIVMEETWRRIQLHYQGARLG